MNGDGSEKIDDGTVDGAPPRAGICRCFALTHCRSAGIKPILKCLLFCPYRNTVREHDPYLTPPTHTPYPSLPSLIPRSLWLGFDVKGSHALTGRI